MNFFREIVDQGRRITVDALSGGSIETDAPWSPDVPEDLREWLPDLFDRFPIVLPWEKPQPVDPALHEVWILDNTAFRSPKQGEHRPDLKDVVDADKAQPAVYDENRRQFRPAAEGTGWEVEMVGAFFVKNSGRDPIETAFKIAEHLDVNQNDDATIKRIASRLQPFLDTVLPNRTLRISIDEGKEEQTLGPSNYQGISVANHELHFPITADPAHSTILPTIGSNAVNLPPPFSLPGTTVLADETGWGIISDIDDTIKITDTLDPLGVLHNTFVVETPQPVPGMPETYAQVSRLLNNPPFFYVSASPYVLYPLLHSFRQAHYPQGTILLRDASWQNIGGLITSVTQNVEEYKLSRLEKVHAWFPKRKFVCLGDSTQKDPETYGEAARRWPGWVAGIFIRRVGGKDSAERNGDPRFQSAFKGLDRHLWTVFQDSSEVLEGVQEIAEGGRGGRGARE